MNELTDRELFWLLIGEVGDDDYSKLWAAWFRPGPADRAVMDELAAKYRAEIGTVAA